MQVFNYFPGGNMQGDFPDNVCRSGTAADDAPPTAPYEPPRADGPRPERPETIKPVSQAFATHSYRKVGI